MVLSIKNDEADRLARELATLTGQTMTEAVIGALRDRIDRERSRRGPSVYEKLMRLAAEVQALPVIDPRIPDEIIGYDADGLPA